MMKDWRFPKSIWLLSGVLFYFTPQKASGSTICSQVVSDNVTSIIDCTAVPTAQSSETMTPTTLSYLSTTEAVSATTSIVQATPAMTTETSSIYTTTTATSAISSQTSNIQITTTSLEATTSIPTTMSIAVMTQETSSVYTATSTTNVVTPETSSTQAITTSAATSIEQHAARQTATSSTVSDTQITVSGTPSTELLTATLTISSAASTVQLAATPAPKSSATSMAASTTTSNLPATTTSNSASTAQVTQTVAVQATAAPSLTSSVQPTATPTSKSTSISISSSATTNSNVSHSVGQASGSISPSSAMSTVSPQSSTVMPTLGAQNYDQQIQLKFDGNCSFLSNSTQKAAFETTVREKCANATGRDPATFKDVNASCGSILVSFTVTADSSNQGPSVNESITKLKTLVESGSFTITLPDGRKLTANATHFVAVVIIPPTTMPPTTLATTTTTVAPTTKTDGLEPGAIAGIVVGCFVALALLCILLYVFCFRKNTVRDPTVDVEYNELKNTSGKTNPGYSYK